MKIYDELVWRGLIKDVSSPEIEEKLNNGGLTFYIGTDPTGDSLHIGHFSSFLISKRLKERLEKEGYKVYMTREEDKELSPKKVKDLEARCKMKIETKCDVFISIHQNKFNSEKCFGAQVWYASNEKSMKLAKYVQDSLKEGVKDNNKRLEKAAKEQYKILRDKYDGACLIVECGFLSNNEEEQRLKSESHQNQIVDGITIGINKYFDEIK